MQVLIASLLCDRVYIHKLSLDCVPSLVHTKYWDASSILAPLESCIAGRKSEDVLHWSDNTREALRVAQNKLSTNISITLPRPSDQLWIVTDGSVTQHGIGSTLYVS